jgi:hypothetical protein
MALCPHCQNALPEEMPSHCPNCGGALERAAGASASGGSGADSPPPPVPPSPPVPPPPPAEPPPGGGGGTGGPPRRGGIPWEERDRLGLGTALIETTKQVLGDPRAFFRAMPTTGGIGGPLLYAVIIGWLGLIAAGFYSALFNSVVGRGMARFGESPEMARVLAFTQSWGGFVAQVVFGGVMVAIGVFVASAIYHVMLLILGGARRDFEATFRVVCFAEAPYVLMIVPFCGNLVAWIWGMVLAIIGLSTAHEIGGGKAAAAVLLPLVLVCCCCGLLGALFASSIAALVSHAQ